MAKATVVFEDSKDEVGRIDITLSFTPKLKPHKDMKGTPAQLLALRATRLTPRGYKELFVEAVE